MKVDWVEWLGRGMQLAVVMAVVGGVYWMSTEASRKQDALCDVALSYVEVLERHRGATRQEIRSAQKVADDACAEPESNEY